MERPWHIIALVIANIVCTLGKITHEEIVSMSSAEAVAGGVAKLPCDLSPPLVGDKVHLVIWYKESIDLPIYSYDVRGKSAEGPRHWSENTVLGSRAFFRTNDAPAKLTLESVKESDAGVYRCRIDFKKSPTRNTQVNLTVIIPPDQVTILDEKGDHIPDYMLGPYNEGSSIDITCISTGGRPVPRVTWWQENALLDDSYEVLAERRVKNILSLEKVERRHLHMVFTCQASNNNLVAPISNAITLDLNLRPLWAKLVGDNRPLSSEQTYEISCQVGGARPPPTITWYKGSTLLRNTREMTTGNGNITVSTLTFSPVMEDSGKTLVCRASSATIPGSELEDSWILNIFHVPLVTLELGSNLNASTIREGVDVYFECNIKSNPWVYRVSWRHNGVTLVNNASAGTIVQNQSLVLQSVSRARAGLYTCVGSNQEGDGESNPVPLDVKFAPVCKPNQQTVVGVARHEVAKVLCELEANPPDISFTWRFNNSGETWDLPHSHVASEKTRSIASYTPRTEVEYGTLLCWGRNELGSQQHPCVFHIIPAGRPDPLENCTIQNQTADSLHVECDEGFNGGLPQEFVMEVYDSQSQVLVSNVSSHASVFLASGLPSGLGFDIIVYSINSKGPSDVTHLSAHTLKSAARRTGQTAIPEAIELTPLLGVLGGIVVTLIVIACGIVLVLRLRGKDCDEKHNKTIMAPDLKRSNESMDSLEKNPDIIPQNTDYHEDERAFEKLNSRLYPSNLITIEGRRKTGKEEVTYAELQLGGAGGLYGPMVTSSRPPIHGAGADEQTVYAQIDASLCHVTAETPLISHARESTV
ncbi:nephrin-like isoform X2 [Macrosteles quadrilineatus]|nr:nephrin-like isoform X2 [Macrosteles quadrilineatus]